MKKKSHKPKLQEMVKKHSISTKQLGKMYGLSEEETRNFVKGRNRLVPYHEGGEFKFEPGAFTGGNWRFELNQKKKDAEVYSVFSNEKGLDGMKKCVSVCFVRGQARGKMMTKKEAKANAKLIAQSRNNLVLIKELESFYFNKKQVAGLTIPEVGILSKISEQIKKSI